MIPLRCKCSLCCTFAVYVATLGISRPRVFSFAIFISALSPSVHQAAWQYIDIEGFSLQVLCHTFTRYKAFLSCPLVVLSLLIDWVCGSPTSHGRRRPTPRRTEGIEPSWSRQTFVAKHSHPLGRLFLWLVIIRWTKFHPILVASSNHNLLAKTTNRQCICSLFTWRLLCWSYTGWLKESN